MTGTHPHSIRTLYEGEKAGTDGRLTRYSVILVDPPLKPTKPRRELLKISKKASKDNVSMYKALIAIKLLCDALPKIEGIEFRLVEFTEEADDAFVEYDAWLIEQKIALKGAPKVCAPAAPATSMCVGPHMT